MEPENNIQSGVAVSSHKNIWVISIVVVLVFAVAIFSFNYYKKRSLEKKVDAGGADTLKTEDGATFQSQQELGPNTQQAIPAMPVFTSQGSDGYSPHSLAAEVGKRYQAEFPTHLPVGGRGSMIVTVESAAKYYPVQANNSDMYAIYFPTTQEWGGRSFSSTTVGPQNAMLSVDLKFENQTNSTFYVRGYYYVRFKVGNEYIALRGTTSDNDRYVSPLSSEVFTFFVEAPHNTTAAEFIYGANLDSNNISFNATDPNLVIPLTFKNLSN